MVKDSKGYASLVRKDNCGTNGVAAFSGSSLSPLSVGWLCFHSRDQ